MKKLIPLSLLLTAVIFADLKVGEKLPDITLSDQFGKKLTVDTEDKVLLLSFEKEVAIKTADYLTKQPKNFLQQRHIKYISDISSMPSFITSMFALPKMKKYPFSVMLIRDGMGKDFQHKEGKATLYKLRNRRITDIEFVDPKVLSTVLQ
ncbi:hypothetical protein [Sulfurovum riftiae]|uniref:FAD/FMN-containing dehydrogenase n=1 Tax=Sulfurovum riftiae TaxID=1630136 RepID=A0A151CE85_9BACT|nr:hypothetical protein [Sulfurovum riftiae]KYJ85848.1 hypothetical protein AS592_04460 [Sulfurovum riftiae]